MTAGQFKQKGKGRAGQKALAAIFQSALVQHQAGNLAQAEQLYRQVLTANASHADALHMIGVLAGQVGKAELACEFIAEAISINPSAAAYYNNLGVVLNGRGLYSEAIANFQKALAQQTNYVDALRNMGAAYQAQDQLDDAERCYQQALKSCPNHPDLNNNLGAVVLARGNISEALQYFRRAIQYAPKDVEVLGNLAKALLDHGDVAAAIDTYRQALAVAPAYLELRSNFLMALHYDEHLSPAEVAAEHFAYGELLLPLATLQPPLNREARQVGTPTGRKLRIGFVSGDLRSHPVGYFLEGVLSHLDLANFEVFLYPTQPYRDTLTESLCAMGFPLRCLLGLGDEQACDLIRNDLVDILVDLSGHTAHHRLGVFAWKPAPVQVSWLGYFATTGLKAIDYLLADPVSVRPDEASLFAETVWRLPETRLCFTTPADSPEVSELPASTNGAVTFGCFNNLSKINDAVVSLWCRILNAVPDSRLFLKAKQLNDPEIQELTRKRFGERGVPSDRLILEGWSSREDYLRAYRRVDIALDPFPFTGGATSFECLWMGVPLLTRRGDRMLARQGESLLRAVGLADWIAADDDAYLQLATARAADVAGIAGLRDGLRERLLASAAYDPQCFAAQLGTAFQSMWDAQASLSGDSR